MFISKNYPQNLNESVTIARHYGNGALEFQFKQDAQQLMHRHFQQCAQLIYLHQIPSLQTVDNRLLLFVYSINNDFSTGFALRSQRIMSTTSDADITSAATFLRINVLHPSEYTSPTLPGKANTSLP